MFSWNLVTPLISVPITSRRYQKQINKAKRIPYNPENNNESDIALPRGVWWLKHKNVENEALFGNSFVIHRDITNKHGLILSQHKDLTVQIWIPTFAGELAISQSQYKNENLNLLPPEVMFTEGVIDVDPVTIEEEDDDELNKKTTAIVFYGTEPEALEGSFSPRRTAKLKFKCDRCQTQNSKFINPHAFNNGIVICQCDGCDVKHLVSDRKEIFSCLKGPLSSRIVNRNKIKIPKNLPQNPRFPND